MEHTFRAIVQPGGTAEITAPGTMGFRKFFAYLPTNTTITIGESANALQAITSILIPYEFENNGKCPHTLTFGNRGTAAVYPVIQVLEYGSTGDDEAFGPE